MNCFNHQTNSAKSQCIICHKGLCEQCYHLKNEVSVCKSKICEKRADGYINALSYHDYKSSSGVLFLIAGLSFIAAGFFGIIHNDRGHIAFVNISILSLGLLYIKPLLKMINEKPQIKADPNAKWDS